MLRLESKSPVSQAEYPTMLFCVREDPMELKEVTDEEQEEKMIRLMKKLMKENDCPEEQFVRMGLDGGDAAV